MDAFVVIALIGVALLVAELLLPTGGTLAVLGAGGLVAAGIVALSNSESAASDVVGPALITLGILSVVSFYFVTRKVIAAQLDEPVRTGPEDMVGSVAEARTSLDPEGQVWLNGALWRARLADEEAVVRQGDRVVVEAVEGLTLVVTPRLPSKKPAEEGAS
jgi:membrane-bound serine protease (ClpP class)